MPAFYIQNIDKPANGVNYKIMQNHRKTEFGEKIKTPHNLHYVGKTETGKVDYTTQFDLADLNGDGLVNLFDLGIFKTNINKTYN